MYVIYLWTTVCKWNESSGWLSQDVWPVSAGVNVIDSWWDQHIPARVRPWYERSVCPTGDQTHSQRFTVTCVHTHTHAAGVEAALLRAVTYSTSGRSPLSLRGQRSGWFPAPTPGSSEVKKPPVRVTTAECQNDKYEPRCFS